MRLNKPLLNVSRNGRIVSIGYWDNGRVIPLVSMDAMDWLFVAAAVICYALRGVFARATR